MDQKKLNLYKNIFKGREDVFGLHWENAQCYMPPKGYYNTISARPRQGSQWDNPCSPQFLPPAYRSYGDLSCGSRTLHWRELTDPRLFVESIHSDV